MSVLLAEIRYAGRALIAQPAWTLSALLCIAIGAGANTTAFSLINGVLLRPLPFQQPHELVMVALRRPPQFQTGPFSLADFREIAPAAEVFQHLAARTYLPVSLAADGPGRMAQAEFVTADYFEMLRVRPLAGSFFNVAADRPGAGLEAVLSERIWRTRFHRDFSIAGKPVRVNGRTVTVRGVAPAGFAGAMQLIAADIWLPASAHGSFASPQSPHDPEQIAMYGALGRLKPGITPMRARRQLDAVIANLWRTRDAGSVPPVAVVDRATGFGVPPAVRRAVAGGSALLYGLMGLLVAVAIANVAGLMLARAAGRSRETAVRLALGAGPSRIVRQLLIEGVILSLAGACLGWLVALSLPHLLTGLGPRLPEHLSYAIDVRPDWRVAVYAAVSAVAIAALFCLAPARQALRTGLTLALKGSTGAGRTRATLRTLNAFVIGQVAVCTVLMVTAGLFVRTYLNTLAVDPGIDLRNALVVSLDLNQLAYGPAPGRAFLDRLLARLSSVPGIRTAALTSQAPLSPGGPSVEVWPVSSGRPAGAHTAQVVAVSPGFFNALRIPLFQGRDFPPVGHATPPVAIINETMARRFWGKRSPVGETFRVGNATGRYIEVIGVAKNIKYRRLSETPAPLFYEPLAQRYSAQVNLILRASADPHLLIDPVRREIQSLNSGLAVIDIRTLEDQYRESAAPALQRSVILVGICGIGLLLSSLGLFGVISYAVRRRVRELGVRMALGARPGHIAAMVLRQALQLVAAGLGIGIVASLAATRIIASVLFGVSPNDPLTLALVAFLLISIALAASYFPARWATRVDPLLAIRAE